MADQKLLIKAEQPRMVIQSFDIDVIKNVDLFLYPRFSWIGQDKVTVFQQKFREPTRKCVVFNICLSLQNEKITLYSDCSQSN